VCPDSIVLRLRVTRYDVRLTLASDDKRVDSSVRGPDPLQNITMTPGWGKGTKK
jgi:hypothetical protein